MFRVFSCPAFPAPAAAVAGQLHAAGPAALAEIRLVQLVFRQREAPAVRKFEFHRLPLEAQARAESLLALQAVSFDFVETAILHKASAGAAENKSDVVPDTLVAKAVKIIHIAVLAPFAALHAAVPWIPDIVQSRSPPYKVKCESLVNQGFFSVLPLVDEP